MTDKKLTNGLRICICSMTIFIFQVFQSLWEPCYLIRNKAYNQLNLHAQLNR